MPTDFRNFVSQLRNESAASIEHAQERAPIVDRVLAAVRAILAGQRRLAVLAMRERGQALLGFLPSSEKSAASTALAEASAAASPRMNCVVSSDILLSRGETSNAERRTSNVERTRRRYSPVRRSAFDVRRSTFPPRLFECGELHFTPPRRGGHRRDLPGSGETRRLACDPRRSARESSWRCNPARW